MFYYFYLGKSDDINDHSRFVIFITLLVLSLVGIATMLLFRHPIPKTPEELALRSIEGDNEPAYVINLFIFIQFRLINFLIIQLLF